MKEINKIYKFKARRRRSNQVVYIYKCFVGFFLTASQNNFFKKPLKTFEMKKWKK